MLITIREKMIVTALVFGLLDFEQVIVLATNGDLLRQENDRTITCLNNDWAFVWCYYSSIN